MASSFRWIHSKQRRFCWSDWRFEGREVQWAYCDELSTSAFITADCRQTTAYFDDDKEADCVCRSKSALTRGRWIVMKEFSIVMPLHWRQARETGEMHHDRTGGSERSIRVLFWWRHRTETLQLSGEHSQTLQSISTLYNPVVTICTAQWSLYVPPV